MKRVLVIGAPGTGKTTLARALGEITGLPVVHLDTLLWNPGWVQTPGPEFDEKVRAALAEPEWIIDGNYGGSLHLRIPQADTVIWLDFPRRVYLLGIVKRRIRHHGRARADVPGCREQLDWEFLKWTWDYPRRSKPRVLQRLAEHGDGKTIVRLLSRADAGRFLDLVSSSAE